MRCQGRDLRGRRRACCSKTRVVRQQLNRLKMFHALELTSGAVMPIGRWLKWTTASLRIVRQGQAVGTRTSQLRMGLRCLPGVLVVPGAGELDLLDSHVEGEDGTAGSLGSHSQVAETGNRAGLADRTGSRG